MFLKKFPMDHIVPHSEEVPKTELQTKTLDVQNFWKKSNGKPFHLGLNRCYSNSKSHSTETSMVLFLALHSWYNANAQSAPLVLRSLTFQKHWVSIATGLIPSTKFSIKTFKLSKTIRQKSFRIYSLHENPVFLSVPKFFFLLYSNSFFSVNMGLVPSKKVSVKNLWRGFQFQNRFCFKTLTAQKLQ